MPATDDDEKNDNVLGVREGKGPDQYGGSFGGGASAGGPYANPHASADRDVDPGKGGQTVQGYHGGGQAGADGSDGTDHHAASRQDSPATDIGSIDDHPSQQPGSAARARFDESLERAGVARSDDGTATDKR